MPGNDGRGMIAKHLLVFALCVVWAASVPIWAAPEIAHFAPHAVVPGRSTLLTFSGSNLDSVSNLWTSFGGSARRMANTNRGLVSFSVTCPADVAGIHALQLIGPEGASNFQLLMIDSLPTEPHHDKHHSPDTAHPITPPSAVDCILKPDKIDYYKFAAKAGETFSIEVIAHRIGSEMDPVASVLDHDGRELAFCDDERGVWKDARFPFQAPSTGDYTIAIHDVGYAGGAAFDYRLRVTHGPLVWFTFPLIDPAAPSAPFENIGSGLPIPKIGSPANPSAAPAFATLPQVIAAEPNDTNTPPIAPPAILHGKLGANRDIDLFSFIAGQGQKLIFQSQTRSLGSPCDLVLRVLKADGAQVAQSDLNSPSEAALTNEFSEAGAYLLEVRGLSGAAPGDFPYRVEFREFAPGFTASSEKNILAIKPGESTKLKVTALRYDYDGPIEFRLEPAPPGLTLENNTIAEKKDETELVIKAAGNASPGAFHHVKIIARGSSEFSVPVSTRPALRDSFPLMLNPPRTLDGIFALSVIAK